MIRRLAGRIRAYNRTRTVKAVVVGYPKTGNTWLRFMLGSYLRAAHGLSSTPLLDEFDRLGRAVRYGGLPGITVTHQPLVWDDQTAAGLSAANVVEPFRGKTVVLLVRHPLDTLVSAWHQARNKVDPPYEGTLEDFVDDEVYGYEKLVRFYSLWRDAHDSGFPVTLVRYEDMQADAGRELCRVLAALGVTEPDAAAVATAVADSSFESMQRLEVSGDQPRYPSSGLPIFASGDPDNPNARHVRRGEVGAYRTELAPDVVARCEQRIDADLGPWFGYSVETSARTAATR